MMTSTSPSTNGDTVVPSGTIVTSDCGTPTLASMA